MEKIICAALWLVDFTSDKFDSENLLDSVRPKNLDTGIVIRGESPYDCDVIGHLLLRDGKTTRDYKQNKGYVTSDNRFVSRKEAAEIAFKAGQVEKDTPELMFNHKLI